MYVCIGIDGTYVVGIMIHSRLVHRTALYSIFFPIVADRILADSDQKSVQNSLFGGVKTPHTHTHTKKGWLGKVDLLR